MRAVEHTTIPMPSAVGLALLIGGLAGVTVVWLFNDGTPTVLAFTAVAVVCFAMFFRLGGHNLVPSAVFFYSLGLLGGVAGLLALATGSRPSGGVAEVALMLLAVSVAGAILAVRMDGAPLSSRGSPWGIGDVSWGDIQWLRSLGLGMLAIAVLAIPVRDLGPIGSASAYIGVLCVTLAAALAASRSQPVALTSYVPFVALAGAVYLVTAFSGFGRIVVAELGLAALICVGFVRPARWPKLLLTMGVVPRSSLWDSSVKCVAGAETFARLRSSMPTSEA